MTPAERTLLLLVATNLRDELIGIGSVIDADQITRAVDKLLAESRGDGIHERSSDLGHG